MKTDYDFVAIGGETAGLVASGLTASFGARSRDSLGSPNE